MLASALACSAPLAARDPVIDARGTTVGEVAVSIARQTGASVAIRDARLAARPARSVHGRMDAQTALRQLAEQGPYRLRRVGKRAYVLEIRAQPAAAPTRVARGPRPSPPPIVEPLAGQDDGPPIVITATKRDLPPARYAGQWTRIDGDAFVGLGPVGTEEIGIRTVGLSSTHLGAGRNKLFIRGIADSSFSGPTQSPVGQYFGELRTGYSGPDPDLRLVDIDKVEILEGPQGTLYGSGAIGGILRINPVAASVSETSLALSVGGSLTQHGESGRDVAGVANFALGHGNALRLVGYGAREGGYIDAPDAGRKDVNGLDVLGARAQLALEAGPEWQVEVNAAAQAIDADDAQYADDAGRLARAGTLALPNASDYAHANLVARRTGDGVRLLATVGASRQSIEETFDASRDEGPRRLAQDTKVWAVSSELRAYRPMRDGYGWLAGVSLLTHQLELSRSLETGTLTRDLAGTRNSITEWTGYGEGTVALDDWLDAGIGARVTRSTIDGSGHHLMPSAIIPRDDLEPDRTQVRVLPSASLVARPLEGGKLYLRYQHGFRPGGVTVADGVTRRFRHDLVKTAEAGFDWQHQPTAITVAGSVSHSDWSGIQADYLDIDGLPVTANVGDGRVWSATLNLEAPVGAHWRLEAGAAFNDGEISEPDGALLATLSVAAKQVLPIPNIARAVARAAVEWDARIGKTAWSGQLHLRHIGHSYLGIGPRLGERQGDYVETGASLRAERGNMAVTLSATNLLDTLGNRFAFGRLFEAGDALTPLRPRTIRLGIDRKM